MITELTPRPRQELLLPTAEIGHAANDYAAAAVFVDYTSRKSHNTLRAQQADLASYVTFLEAAHGVPLALSAVDLQSDPQRWSGTTWGLVDGFTKWLLSEGYAIGTINRKLSTVKIYVKLAAKTGSIPLDELGLIQAVVGYGHTEGKRIDQRRPQSRVGHKKAQNTSLSTVEARALKAQPDTPQGRRDALIMTLLLDHGLRVGELAGLKRQDFNLEAGTFAFYRPKVDRTQTHRMSAATLAIVTRWFTSGDAPKSGPLLRGSRKNGELDKPGMSERAITARVRFLAEELGIHGLSAHDCRHYWATQAARHGTDAFVLRDAGGWNSLAMPSRYVEESSVANAGVKLE